MKNVQEGFVGLMVLAVLGWVSGPLAAGTALADNTPTPAAPPAMAPAPAAPAMAPAAPAMTPKPAAKKAVKKVAKKKMSHAPTFMGVVKGMDMNSSPMTLVVVKDSGKKSEFVFGGDLSKKTAVFKGKKKVGMNALQEGQKVTLHYGRTHDGVAITAIWIH